MTVVRGLPVHLGAAARCLVMGVLNVTPDSFSDGGHYLATRAAIDHGLRLLADGADIIDVGGESTRPGAARVAGEEERRRVLPVVRALAAAGAVVSIDTMRADTARAALDEGAVLVNDVSGGQADDAMAGVVAAAGVPYVAMHWRGYSDTMQQRTSYHDVVADVAAELQLRMDALVAQGVHPEQVILDPGIGFAKEANHNWRLLANLESLLALGRPVLVGASRKRFLDDVVRGAADGAGDPAAREHATAAISTLAAARGAWAVRVHDVIASRDAVRVAARIHEEAAAASPPVGARLAQRAGSRMSVSDRITVSGLRGFGRHGVYDEERASGQDFVVDLVLTLDVRRAARSDDVADTVHYGELAQRVLAVVEGEPVNLLETLAERIASVCLGDNRVVGADVTVHKPNAPVGVPVTDISVTITRP